VGFKPTRPVLLQPPPVRGGTLKHLKLVLPVEVMARRLDVLTVADPAKAADKESFADDGLRFKVQTFQMVDANAAWVKFTVSVSAGRTLDPNTLGLRLIDAKDGEYLGGPLAMNAGLQYVREPEPEDLVWLSGAPQAGFPAPLPWAALAPGSLKLDRRQWTGSAQFSGPIGAPAKLALFRFERLRTELPFEFHDLPLP
jgi:hypothetical protein